jgi:hypothetical protein
MPTFFRVPASFKHFAMPLTPPPDQIFSALASAIESAQTHAGNHGYAVAKLRSKKNKAGDMYKVWLKCDRGGKYRTRGLTDDTRQRLTASRCIDCPFSAIVQLNQLGDWVLVSKNIIKF